MSEIFTTITLRDNMSPVLARISDSIRDTQRVAERFKTIAGKSPDKWGFESAGTAASKATGNIAAMTDSFNSFLRSAGGYKPVTVVADSLRNAWAAAADLESSVVGVYKTVGDADKLSGLSGLPEKLSPKASRWGTETAAAEKGAGQMGAAVPGVGKYVKTTEDPAAALFVPRTAFSVTEYADAANRIAAEFVRAFEVNSSGALSGIASGLGDTEKKRCSELLRLMNSANIPLSHTVKALLSESSFSGGALGTVSEEQSYTGQENRLYSSGNAADSQTAVGGGFLASVMGEIAAAADGAVKGLGEYERKYAAKAFDPALSAGRTGLVSDGIAEYSESAAKGSAAVAGPGKKYNDVMQSAGNSDRSGQAAAAQPTALWGKSVTTVSDPERPGKSADYLNNTFTCDIAVNYKTGDITGVTDGTAERVRQKAAVFSVPPGAEPISTGSTELLKTRLQQIIDSACRVGKTAAFSSYITAESPAFRTAESTAIPPMADKASAAEKLISDIFGQMNDSAWESPGDQPGLSDRVKTGAWEAAEKIYKSSDSPAQSGADAEKNISSVTDHTGQQLERSREAFEGFKAVLSEGTLQAAELVAQMAANLRDSQNKGAEYVNGAGEQFAALSQLEQTASDSASQWQTGLSALMNGAYDVVSRSIDSINGAAPLMRAAGENVMRSYSEGITGAMGLATAAAVNVANSVQSVLGSISVRVPVTSSSPAVNSPADLKALRGYAVGTLSAAPGLALVGEKGPELVSFGGGEVVYTAQETQRILGGLSDLSVTQEGQLFDYREIDIPRSDDKLSLSDSDRDHLIRLGEGEAINKIANNDIKIEMVNNNSISGETDIDGMIDYLASGLKTALATATEGVHS